MTTGLTLEQVDADGALRDAAGAVGGDTRAQFLTKAGLGGAFGGPALWSLMTGEARAQGASDIAILNFALTLEYLEAAFYAEAIDEGALDGELALFARVAGGHEAAHVRALRAALGRQAVARPRFNFRGTTEDAEQFTATAVVLEDTGVRAYAGQAPRVEADAVLAAALAIHTVEARHAAWIRDIAGEDPAPRAFDRPLSRAAVLSAVRGTRFIVAAQAPSRDSGDDSDGSASPRFPG